MTTDNRTAVDGTPAPVPTPAMIAAGASRAWPRFVYVRDNVVVGFAPDLAEWSARTRRTPKPWASDKTMAEAVAADAGLVDVDVLGVRPQDCDQWQIGDRVRPYFDVSGEVVPALPLA